MSTILTDRQGNYDLLRIISAFAVILLHVNAYYLELHCRNLNIASKFVIFFENFINTVTRFSVPCFVMLSGAFVMNNKTIENIKLFYCKSIYKLFIPFIEIYLVWVGIAGLRVFRYGGMIDYAKNIIKINYGNLWFMPMFFGIYILAPALKKLRNGHPFSVSVGIIMMIWAMLSQCSSNYTLPFSCGVVVAFLSYFILGDILYNLRIKRNRTIIWSLIGFALVIVTTMWRCKGNDFFLINPYRAFFRQVL